MGAEARYQVGEVLGQGAFGTVRAAKDRRHGSDCVLKVVERRRAARGSFKPDREAEIHKGLDHPNIAKVYETISGALQVCIVMELCRGGDLFEALEQYDRACSEVEARHIFRQVMCALGYMHHHGLAHRDLKLDNLLIEEPNASLSKCTIKLIDFGFAARFKVGTASLKTTCGTPEYMAPEILARAPYGEKCDVWSSGVVLFILLCGFMPFDGESREELIRNIRRKPVRLDQAPWESVSQEAQDLVVRACCKAVSRRPSSREAAAHPWLLKACDGGARNAWLGGA